MTRQTTDVGETSARTAQMPPRAVRRAREREASRQAKRRARFARRSALSAGIAVGAGAILVPAAEAANFQVNSLADTGDGVCDAFPGQCTLRDAIDDANNSPNAVVPDTVDFRSGLSGSINLYAGEIPITEALTINGPGTDLNGDHLIAVEGQDARIFNASTVDLGLYGLSVYDLELRRGIATVTATDPGVDGAYGGAILAGDAPLTITDSNLHDNRAGSGDAYGVAAYGGAVYSPGPITITDSTLTDNAAIGATDGPTDSLYNASGGAVAAEGGAVSISGSTLLRNEADGYYAGGGAVVSDGGAVSITGSSTLQDNTADAYNYDSAEAVGGGVASYGGDVDITSSTLRNNVASGSSTFGGGVYSDVDVTSVDITGGSTLENNRASGKYAGFGGGVSAEGGEVSITGSTLRSNAANASSGISNNVVAGGGGVNAYNADASITGGSTLQNNTTYGYYGAVGGGVAAYQGDVSISGASTLQSNSASSFNDAVGGGVGSLDGDVEITGGSTLSQNGASDAGGGIASSGTVADTGAVTITEFDSVGQHRGRRGRRPHRRRVQHAWTWTARPFRATSRTELIAVGGSTSATPPPAPMPSRSPTPPSRATSRTAMGGRSSITAPTAGC